MLAAMPTGERPVSSAKARTLLLLVVVYPLTLGAGDHRFSSPECRIAFSYPANWVISKLAAEYPQAGPCEFRVRPKNWKQLLAAQDNVDVHTVDVAAFANPFEAALDESGFERKEGKWVVLGRMGAESPAEEIKGRGWFGVRGIRSEGCYREGGGYVGLCDVPAAFVSNSEISVRIDALPQADLVFEKILRTLRFLPPKQ